MKTVLLIPLIALLCACGNTYVTEIRPVVVQPMLAPPLYQDSLTVTTTTTTVETDTLYP